MPKTAIEVSMNDGVLSLFVQQMRQLWPELVLVEPRSGDPRVVEIYRDQDARGSSSSSDSDPDGQVVVTIPKTGPAAIEIEDIFSPVGRAVSDAILCACAVTPNEDENVRILNELLETTHEEKGELAWQVLCLALDLDAWTGADEEWNSACVPAMMEAIRGKLGLPCSFGEWLVTQHEREDSIGVVARFVSEQVGTEAHRFPEAPHLYALLTKHGRQEWADGPLRIAYEEYEDRHAKKLSILVAEHEREMERMEREEDAADAAGAND